MANFKFDYDNPRHVFISCVNNETETTLILDIFKCFGSIKRIDPFKRKQLKKILELIATTGTDRTVADFEVALSKYGAEEWYSYYLTHRSKHLKKRRKVS